MDHKYKITFFILSIIATEVYSQDCEPDVTIPEGSIRGVKLKTNKGSAFYAFMDVPYAMPPMGKLRFQEPLPARKWRETLNATVSHKICVQFDTTDQHDPRETEDCLVVNVYVPAETFCNCSSPNTLPVLIWIHGGSFRSWSGSYDDFGPHYFIDQNIVVVAVNYRLGPLGFLTTGDEVIPGNLALKDQHLAIRWVWKKIRTFGGDPKRITLMGQSAGAMCVGYHIMDPRNTGTISAAIMHSASPLSCSALQKHPKDLAYLLAKNIDPTFSNTNTSQDLLRLLRNTSIAAIKAGAQIQVPEGKLNCQKVSSLPWIPTKEPPGTRNPVVTGMNHEKIKNGAVLRIPLLTGYNSQENSYFGTPGGYTLLSTVYDLGPSHLLNANLNIEDDERAKAGAAIKALYTNYTFLLDVENVVTYSSDNYFAVPVGAFGHYHSRHSDVYGYRFDFKGVLGQLNSSFQGVGHGEELNYFFQNSVNQNLSAFAEEEIITHERVVELWSQFIKYKNPTKYTNDLLQWNIWPKFGGKVENVLQINKHLCVKKNPNRYREWLDIFQKYAACKLDTF